MQRNLLVAQKSMIKAVFFDLYNTLAGFDPPREQVQTQAAGELGLRLERAGIVRGYADADNFMGAQNALGHLSGASPEKRLAFFARYEQLILKGAGVDAPLDLAADVWERVKRIPYDLALYGDVLPCLRALRAKGMSLGIISNLEGDLAALIRRLGLDASLDFIVSSKSAGVPKPHPHIFQSALWRAGVLPSQAVHIGDQYNGDVVGAREVGIYPLLLDREGILGDFTDVMVISGLAQVPALLDALPSGDEDEDELGEVDPSLLPPGGHMR